MKYPGRERGRLKFYVRLFDQGLIGLGEEDFGLGGVAGEDIFGGLAGLVEGDAADGGFGFFFDFGFVGAVGSEEDADEAAFFVEDFFHFVVGAGRCG